MPAYNKKVLEGTVQLVNTKQKAPLDPTMRSLTSCSDGDADALKPTPSMPD